MRWRGIGQGKTVSYDTTWLQRRAGTWRARVCGWVRARGAAEVDGSVYGCGRETSWARLAARVMGARGTIGTVR